MRQVPSELTISEQKTKVHRKFNSAGVSPQPEEHFDSTAALKAISSKVKYEVGSFQLKNIDYSKINDTIKKQKVQKIPPSLI